MKTALLLLVASIAVAETRITDVSCGALDVRSGKVEVSYTVTVDEGDPPAVLRGTVVDHVTGKTLADATLSGVRPPLKAGSFRAVWHMVQDAPNLPASRVVLRLRAEPILVEKEDVVEVEVEETSPRLLFHCSLDSMDAIAACGGTATGAEFVEGVHGMGIQVGHAKDPIQFPLENVITNFRCGSVEIWAKILEPERILACSANELNLVNLRRVNDDVGNFFRISLTTNNGHGQSGLGVGISNHDKASTHIGRIGPFDISSAIGGGNPAEWHHYRFSWDADGIGGSRDRMAVFVDGHKIASSAEPLFEINPNWDHYPYILKISESNGSQPMAIFDDLKLWDSAVVPGE